METLMRGFVGRLGSDLPDKYINKTFSLHFKNNNVKFGKCLQLLVFRKYLIMALVAGGMVSHELVTQILEILPGWRDD